MTKKELTQKVRAEVSKQYKDEIAELKHKICILQERNEILVDENRRLQKRLESEPAYNPLREMCEAVLHSYAIIESAYKEEPNMKEFIES